MATEFKHGSFGEFKAMMALLAPTIVGLMLARLGIIVSTYGAYNSTDSGLFTDGSTLISIIPLIGMVFYFGHTKKHFNKHQVYIFSKVSILVQALSIVLLGLFLMGEDPSPYISFALSIVITSSSWFAIFYWLRRARGTTSSVAVAIVFGALMLSEPLIYMFSLMHRSASCFIVGFVVLGQFWCRKAARNKPLPEHAHSDHMPLGYFGFAERMVDTVKLLAVLALGMLVLSIVVGALRGYPNGVAIAFTPLTRVAYMCLLIVCFSILIWRSFVGSRTVMTTSIWLCLETLGMMALMCYVMFPDALEIGAIFTTVFNAGMTGFMWYLVIAFSSYGDRDCYYYAAAGWIVFLLPRAITRLGMVWFYTLFPVPAVELMFIACLILISSQVVFTQLVWLEQAGTNKSKQASKGIQSLLGLDNIGPSDPVSMRKALMQTNTARLKDQFLLSDRETEILTMYALGMTQKKIAEDLCISQGTAHTHIKRIYTKTNLHSRQEILDYIEQYANE